MPSVTGDDALTTRARDALYTAVGFGVLAVQRLQVTRQDLRKDLSERLGGDADVSRLVKQMQVVADPVLDLVERQLPLPGRLVLRQARRAARDVLR